MPTNTAMWRPYRPRRVAGAEFGTPVEQLRGTVPRGPYPISENVRVTMEKKRLYSVATRRYLRRRAWRYFRKLGKQGIISGSRVERGQLLP